VALSADLSKYTDLIPFIEALPDRFFNIGMAEQNLFSMAAGMARTGMVAVLHHLRSFRDSPGLRLHAIGSRMLTSTSKSSPDYPIDDRVRWHAPGYRRHRTRQADSRSGGHRSLRCTEIAQVVDAVAEYQGPVYVRLLRASFPWCSIRELPVRHWQGQVAAGGRDMGFISTGFMTERALDAAAELAKRGIKAGVLHVPTLKPLDSEAIAKFAASVAQVLVAENHVSSGGLAAMWGSSV